MNKTDGVNKYFIEVVAKALDVLDSFRRQDDELTLSEISKRTGLYPSYAFRLLYTLEQKGWVRRVAGTKKYHRVNRTQRWRVGFAMQSGELEFSHDVLGGLEEAAERHGVQLIVADNQNREDAALENAEMFARQGVDFVIEFQVNERIAPVIAHMLAEANIPCLAIDIPQPGAVFFGADNYRAGLMAGRALGEHARDHWGGQADRVVLLELPQAGPVPQARITGALNGIQEVVGSLPEASLIHLDCRGTLEESRRVTLACLKQLWPSARILMAAINDPAALGAVRAIADAGWTSETAVVVGQDATQEARAEMNRPGSCLLGSVGYFPEKYGEQIIPLVLKILGGEPVPPTVHIQHRLITRDNAAQFYPAAGRIKTLAPTG
ncbi:MAG TPA: substrate-binding domain-containing protein [Blastocatellia bacterium]|nr:substrate-binding domain-containing protein [Blastocatellia bacterium]